MKKVLLLVPFIILLFSSPVYAQVVINEFQIDPTPQVVELFNKGTDSVDISNWYIDDSGGATYFTIPTETILYPNSCLVFSADFNLNKSSSDTIRLFNSTASPTSASATLIDSFSYKLSPGSGISFLRLPDGGETWATASSSLGNFNQTDTSCIITPTPTQTPVLTPTPTSPPEPTTTISHNKIYLSEVMVNPQSGENEWVELYNDNDFSVTLVDWYVDDLENAGSSPKLFSLEINAKSYAYFDLTSSMFNNDGDSVRLLDFNKVEKDGFEYDSSEKGKTLGRNDFEDDNVCIQKPSKGFNNFPCLDDEGTTTLSQTNSITITPVAKAKNADFSTSLVNSAPTLASGISNTQQGEVLGTTSVNHATMKQSSNLSKAFSFVSFSYSILTLLSILLKMRIGA